MLLKLSADTTTSSTPGFIVLSRSILQPLADCSAALYAVRTHCQVTVFTAALQGLEEEVRVLKGSLEAAENSKAAAEHQLQTAKSDNHDLAVMSAINCPGDVYLDNIILGALTS